MAELEKVQLLNFDIDQYLKDGDATVAACAQAKAVADEIHEHGYGEHLPAGHRRHL